MIPKTPLSVCISRGIFDAQHKQREFTTSERKAEAAEPRAGAPYKVFLVIAKKLCLFANADLLIA